MRHRLGEILFEVIVLARGFKDSDGRHFSNVLVQELLMGRLADALQRDRQERKSLGDQVTSLTNTVTELGKLNTELSNQGSSAPITTPGGYTVDSDDLAEFDRVLAEVTSGVPVPNPPVPA